MNSGERERERERVRFQFNGKAADSPAGMWRRPLGNPVEYAASSPTRPIALPIFCSISQSRPPPPPTMAVGNHVLAPLQIACKTIGGKCERRMAHSRPGQGVPTDRDRSPRCRRSYSPKIVPMVNEYIFRSGLTASPLPFHSSILGDDKVDNRNTEVYGREIQLEGTASQVLISNRISRKIRRCCVI